MNRILPVMISVIMMLCIAGCTEYVPQRSSATTGAEVQQWYIAHIDQFDISMAHLERVTATTYSNTDSVRAAFLAARLAYKWIESLAETFAPSTARALNGPAIDQVEEDDPNQIVISPEGLQVIEGDIYAEPMVGKDTTLEHIAITRSNIKRLRVYAASMELSDQNIFDAMRLQIVRIITLGITGFDTPMSSNGIAEAEVSIRSIRRIFEFYQDRIEAESKPAVLQFDSLVVRAVAALQHAHTFESFDRLSFITDIASPMMRSLLHSQNVLKIPLPEDPRGLRVAASTPFDTNAFDAMYYAPPYSGSMSSEKIRLGRILFFDPVLSGDGSRSCASCHQPEKAFTDGIVRSVAFDRQGTVARNAPTLLNAAFQAMQFYDGRVSFLEDQSSTVIANPIEMHGSLAEVVARLRQSPQYVELFRAAFGADTLLREEQLKVALASYIRSLVAMNAPFDRYMRGDRNAMPVAARRGFNLFMGKAACGTCHFMPLFNGTVPPRYTETEAEILGVTTRFDTIHAELDSDLGRFNVHGIAKHRFAFKTPTLRNVALTAPYMHNGAFETLEQVVEFYNRGGGAGLGLDVPGQTLSAEPLNLSATERSDLMAFLESLSDTTGTRNLPEALPVLARKNRGVVQVSRTVGGSY